MELLWLRRIEPEQLDGALLQLQNQCGSNDAGGQRAQQQTQAASKLSGQNRCHDEEPARDALQCSRH